MDKPKSNLFFIIVLVMSLLNSSCLSDEKSSNDEAANIEAVASKKRIQIQTDVDIPTLLWSKIEGVYSADSKKAMVSGAKTIEIDNVKKVKKNIPIRFNSFQILLDEIDKNVLGGENLILEFGFGGGELDFSNFLKTDVGRFRLKVLFKEIEGGWSDLKVFYWPNGKKRNINGVVIGSGCGESILDLSSFYKKTLVQDGMVVTVDKKKHHTVLAGTYVFVGKANKEKNNELYVAQLTITDNRYKILQCRN